MPYSGKFGELLKENGLVVVEEGQEGGCGGALLDVIYNRRALFVPWLARAALFLRRHAKNIKDSRFLSMVDQQRGKCLIQFLERLRSEGLILRYEYDLVGDQFRFLVAFPESPERQQFFRSKWAEACFRRLAKLRVRHYLHQTDQTIPYLFRHNVKIAKIGDEKRVLTEIDLLLEMGDRVYVFEVKSGPWVRILQWAQKEILFASPRSRIITCMTYPGIPSEIFEPQILLTLDSFESSLLKILEADFGVKIPVTRSKEALWEAHETPAAFIDCENGIYDDIPDTRTLAQRLDEDVFHMPGAGWNDCCNLVRDRGGEIYADYDLNEFRD